MFSHIRTPQLKLLFFLIAFLTFLIKWVGKGEKIPLLGKEVGREIAFSTLLKSLYPIFLYCSLITNTNSIYCNNTLRTCTLTKKEIVMLLPVSTVIS